MEILIGLAIIIGLVLIFKSVGEIVWDFIDEFFIGDPFGRILVGTLSWW